MQRPGFGSWIAKIPWRRKRQPTRVFVPGEFHWQRSPGGYNPWGHTEQDTTEQPTLSLSRNVMPRVEVPEPSEEYLRLLLLIHYLCCYFKKWPIIVSPGRGLQSQYLKETALFPQRKLFPLLPTHHQYNGSPYQSMPIRPKHCWIKYCPNFYFVKALLSKKKWQN